MHWADFTLRLKPNTQIVGVGFGIFVLAIYLFSLCPIVYLIDSGELAAVSYTLGIAHPTGYPLYTLISYFFSHLPSEPIKNLNILSALFSVTAVVFLYLTTKRILKNNFAPIIITSLFAFSPTIWRTSITNEVYPLTALFCVLIIYYLYKLNNTKVFYMIMFLVGLSFTNHIIIFSLVLPLFGYIIFVHRPTIKQVIIGLIFGALGLSLYLYLITRTIGGAELAWGNTYNLQRLFWHLTGKQYQVWMFSLSLKEIINNIKQGSSFILSDFLYILIIPVLLGFYQLFKSERKKFFLFFAIFLLNFLYAVNYAIPDIESYYIPGFVGLIFFAIYGLKLIQAFLKWFIILPIALLIPLLNYKSCTLRNNTFGLDYSSAHILQLPDNSLLISDFWDIYSPTIYLQEVKGIRKDLVIIDKELLRRTWYIKYLKNKYPEFCKSVEKEVNDFLTELYKFEYGKPYDPYKIQSKYIKMLESFVDVKISEGVYFAIPFPDKDLNQVKPDYYRVPQGLNYLITRDTTYVLFDFSKLSINKPAIINDKRLEYNIGFVQKMLGNNIMYLNSINRFKEAEQAKEWLKRFSN